MRSRADRATEALELSEGYEAVVWALALNEHPLRRSYFVDVTGYEESPVVKVLARLANADVLAPTDGLRFSLADKALAPELLRDAEPEMRVVLHEKSLEYDGEQDLPPAYYARHALGSGDHARAARIMLDIIADPEAKAGTSLLGPMKQSFAALFLDANADGELLESLGLQILETGIGLLRPREFSTLVEQVGSLPLADEERARLDAMVAKRKAARAEAKKAAADASAQPAGPESPDA